MELDEISRDNVLKFKIPPYITIIIRSLTILEGFALDVDPNFRLIRGAYPYVLKQLLSPEGMEQTPKALNELLVRLLTVNGDQKEVEWGESIVSMAMMTISFSYLYSLLSSYLSLSLLT